jgi:hypothetical protein
VTIPKGVLHQPSQAQLVISIARLGAEAYSSRLGAADECLVCRMRISWRGVVKFRHARGCRERHHAQTLNAIYRSNTVSTDLSTARVGHVGLCATISHLISSQFYRVSQLFVCFSFVVSDYSLNAGLSRLSNAIVLAAASLSHLGGMWRAGRRRRS